MPEYEVFVASPISGWQEDPEIGRGRNIAEGLADALTARSRSVFFAGYRYGRGGETRLPDFSLNLALVEDSAALVLVTAESAVSRSSIWVEVGMAFARRMPIFVAAPAPASLPLLVARALARPSEGGDPNTTGCWFEPDQSVDQIVSRLADDVDLWLGTRSHYRPDRR